MKKNKMSNNNIVYLEVCYGNVESICIRAKKMLSKADAQYYTLNDALRLGFENKHVTRIIEISKEKARNLNELTDHLIKLLESDDKRFSFEFCAGGTMEIYDKEKEIGYAVHVAPIEYDEDGNAINL